MNPEGRAYVRRKHVTVPIRSEMFKELEQIAFHAGLTTGGWIAELVENEIADRRLRKLTTEHRATTKKHYPRVSKGDDLIDAIFRHTAGPPNKREPSY